MLVYIREKEKQIEEKRVKLKSLEENVTSANEEIEGVKDELVTIVEKLQKVNIENEAFRQAQKRQQLVKDLRTIFGDRVVSDSMYLSNLHLPFNWKSIT